MPSTLQQKAEPFASTGPARPPGGFFARLSRWLLGPSPTDEVHAQSLATPPRPRPLLPPSSQARESAAAAPVREREPLASPAEKISAPARRPIESLPPSRVDQVLAVLTLERVLPELDAARREIEEMKIASSLQIRQLEAECDQLRGEAENARAAKAEADSRAEMLQKTLADLEPQLQEARGTAGERIRQLEAERDQRRSEAESAQARWHELDLHIRELAAERDQRRSEAESAQAELHDLRLRIRQVEAMLDVNQASHSPEEWTALESRVRTLEEELEAAQRRAKQEHEAVEMHIQRFETERGQLAAQHTAKEEDLRVLSEQAENALARVRELEAELAEWKARPAGAPPTEPQPPQEAAPALPVADVSRLTDLHQQTMSRLTVVLASADLLAMNPRLDSSVRETAQEIRDQGKLLAEIIKSFTLPPDTRPAE